jgi:hypothetical protein
MLCQIGRGAVVCDLEAVMNLRTCLAILALSLLCIGCSSRPNLFHEDFEAYDIGWGGIENPPTGGPSDALVMFSANRVINSVPLGSKAVEVWGNWFECVTGGGPDGSHTRGEYDIFFKAYMTDKGAFRIGVYEYGGIRHWRGVVLLAFQLYDGDFRLVTDEKPWVRDVYSPNVVHEVAIHIDMDVQRFWIYIDGTEVASDEEFYRPDHNTYDVHFLRFATDPLLGGNDYGPRDAYVIDDITIMGPTRSWGPPSR